MRDVGVRFSKELHLHFKRTFVIANALEEQRCGVSHPVIPRGIETTLHVAF
jgi:hypothetical protein